MSAVFSILADLLFRTRILSRARKSSQLPESRVSPAGVWRAGNLTALGTATAHHSYLCRKAWKGRPMVLSSPQTASASMPAPAGGTTHSRRADDLTYQAVTVAAILLLLASLWVF
jgi:hypothetical protein